MAASGVVRCVSMVKLAGRILIAMAVLHGIMSIVLFHDGLARIWTAGFGAGLTWDFEMLASFWFLIFTWLMASLGIVIAGVGKSGQTIPGRKVVGWSLVLVPILCGLFVPISGLWAFILPGALLLPHAHDDLKNVLPMKRLLSGRMTLSRLKMHSVFGKGS